MAKIRELEFYTTTIGYDVPPKDSSYIMQGLNLEPVSILVGGWTSMVPVYLIRPILGTGWYITSPREEEVEEQEEHEKKIK